MVVDYEVKTDGNKCFIDVKVSYPRDHDAYEKLESIILQIQCHIIHELQIYKSISFACKVTLFESDITWQKEFYMNEQNTLRVISHVHPFFLKFDDIIKHLT